MIINFIPLQNYALIVIPTK